jgi:hypothetical protein
VVNPTTLFGGILFFVGFHRKTRWIGNQVRNNKNKEATKMESFKTIKKIPTHKYIRMISKRKRQVLTKAFRSPRDLTTKNISKEISERLL